jgi:hypothetical protein
MEHQIENTFYGVEIEHLIPDALTVHQLADRLTQAGVRTEVEGYNHIVRGHWKFVSDASLTRQAGYSTWELVAPKLMGEDGLEQIRKVSAVLVAAGCRVNQSCGLHVHVDATNRQLPWFKNLFRLYAQFEPVIDTVLAPSRRGSSNQWCRPVRYAPAMDQATNLHQLRAAYAQDVGNLRARYKKLNLESFFRHSTVEFRAHQGTVEARKIINWITFCLKLALAADEPPTAFERGRLGDDRIIRLLVSRNPKRVGSATYERFARYETGMTVARALALGLTRNDLRWDADHGFIRIEDGTEGQAQGIVTSLDGLMRVVKATSQEASYFNERATTLAARARR